MSAAVLRRNAIIAVVVGIVLSVANQFDVILEGPMKASLLVKIGMNFLIPFAVSCVSAYVNRSSES